MPKFTPGNGSIYWTTTMDLAIQESYRPNTKVLFVDDLDSGFFQSYNNPAMINGSILLPPYPAMVAYEDKQDQQFASLYNQHIVTYSSKIISAIMNAMCKGYNILLYIPDHIFNQVEYLLSYFVNQHGICVGSDHIPYSYNPAMDDNNLRMMYMYGHIDAYTALMNMDLDCLRVDIELLNHFLVDFNPPVLSNNKEDFIIFFKNYKNSMLQAGRPLQQMLSPVESNGGF